MIFHRVPNKKERAYKAHSFEEDLPLSNNMASDIMAMFRGASRLPAFP